MENCNFQGVREVSPANTQKCITFIQRWTNVGDVGPMLYKCFTNVSCLLGGRSTCNKMTNLEGNIRVGKKEIYAWACVYASPTNMMNWLGTGSTLILRHQRWPTIKAAPGKDMVLAGVNIVEADTGIDCT